MEIRPKSGIYDDHLPDISSVEALSFVTGQIVANRYEILSRLGKGGMSEVWHSYDMKLRVDVALKSLPLDLRNNPNRVEALRQEVRTAREVISPNVCRIFDLVVEENQELISMEFIDGKTLLAMLTRKGALELQEARDIAAQFLAGLDAIHQVGLVHRDLKPENIMITQAGRVVVMDFGIAKQVKQDDERIVGTLGYMSPEQMGGEKIDARSDIFSAGVVLAEMIHPDGILSHKTREGIWDTIHRDPFQLPDSPWKKVIARAVAVHPNDRFQSTGALLRALEEATQRIETIEERKPYPGLLSFSSAQAEYFFGREQELETVLKKLGELHLMALVAPSGAGKTSFLHAALIPALPRGWRHIFCVPGDSPFLNLIHALMPELSVDEDAIQKIFRFDDSEIALTLLNRWRKRNDQAVLIIDRFEELFTLNPPEVQLRFADLVAAATLESDVRVLISIRDDFLLRCSDYPALAPIFSELTPLAPLSGASLRRALVQPALRCGYRYEDETLVDEILRDVEKEKGALPLMAFAASRLWEKRDRKLGELSHGAYKEIGGVAGALAQHAESTIERIGTQRHAIVREIFRNLITGQNTRAVRDTEELLSIFPDGGSRSAAEDVLRALIDGRLLTSFEAPAAEGENPRRRVEIIHESLLSAWPRLVRWQTQDADSALLRDQLRQAALLWEQRSRSEDLLWSGTAFQEFHGWRQRYQGSLTPTEENFAQAMIQRANKKRKQRQISVVTIFVILLAGLAMITSFWRKATYAKNEAITEAARAQASRMLALGRSITDADPSTKLAYALASLEFRDSTEGRLYAQQAMAEGSAASVRKTSLSQVWDAELSPDGNWLAASGDGAVQLFSRDGKGPLIAEEPGSIQLFIPWKSQFSTDGKFLLWTWRKDPSIVKVWSLSQKKVVRTFDLEGPTICLVRAGTAFFITDASADPNAFYWFGPTIIRRWNFDQEKPQVVGNLKIERNSWRTLDIDSSGQLIAYHQLKDVYIRALNASELGSQKLVGSHNDAVDFIRFRPNSQQLASSDGNGEICLWSLLNSEKKPIRVIPVSRNKSPFWFNPKGSFLFGLTDGTLMRWDLNIPDADPVALRNIDGLKAITFDHNEQWMAIAGNTTVAFYSMKHKYSYTFRPTTQTQASSNVRFTPDGRSFLYAFSNDGLLLTSVPGEKQYLRKMLLNSRYTSVETLDVDQRGKYVLASVAPYELHLISVADGKDLPLKGKLPYGYMSCVFSPDTKFVAAAGVKEGIEVWEMQTGTSSTLEKSRGIFFYTLKYGPDGTLFSGDTNGKFYQWNVNDKSVKITHLGKGIVTGIAVSKNGQYVATSTWSVQYNQLGSGTSELLVHDLKQAKSFAVRSHGNRIFSVAFDPSGTKLITGDLDGTIRVGGINGEIPFLLLSSDTTVKSIDIHPTGKWIASSGNLVRLFRMPEGKPLDSLPYNQLLSLLRDLTNVRAVAHKNSPTGYRTEYSSFSGWEKLSN